ncbi:hypothetical protein [Reyranella sp.]|uniref:hypothetical protein n=1 Tax=Reyranella sp. TaxID=1929291 RepID=UPI003D0FB9A5
MLEPLRSGERRRALPAGVVIRPATAEDCHDIAPRLRSADAQELLAATGSPPDVSLPSTLRWHPSVVELEGRPEAIMGCARLDDIEGVPWFASTDVPVSPRWRVAFLRYSRQVVDDWQRTFPLLHNFTDARNTVHHRWLKRIGFTFLARHERFGALGLPFLEFVRIDHHHV